jgi:glycine C-acetyltransferase
MPTPTAPICAQAGEHTQYRRRLIITDGVFSMDGDIAPLDAMCDVAEESQRITDGRRRPRRGVLGRGGRGIVDHFGLHGRVDVESRHAEQGLRRRRRAGGRLPKPIIDWLRSAGGPSSSPAP